MRGRKKTNCSTTVIVFARKPQVGKVKTRLAKNVGAEFASQIYFTLLQRTIAQVSKIRQVRKVLMPSNRRHTRWFRRNYSRLGWSVRPQIVGDLGERMEKAVMFELAQDRSVILIGSDVIGHQAKDIEIVCDWLANGTDVVLGPALDGGYWLVAMRSEFFNIFRGMRWSQSNVFEVTVERLERENCRFQVLAPRQDVDRAQDLLGSGWRGYN
jgi:rSAM/selenodomain-associated transferase 1